MEFAYCYFVFEFVDLICERLYISYVRQLLFIIFVNISVNQLFI